MVAKKNGKTSVVKPKEVKEAVKESKSDLFIRLAIPRVEKVLKSLRILGNCSSKNYSYTTEQTETIFKTVYEAVNLAESKFTKNSETETKFTF